MTARERRRNPRLPMSLTATCYIGEQAINDPLENISSAGLYLRTAADLKVDERARIVLSLPYIGGRRYCTVNGHVRRVDTDAGGRTKGAAIVFDPDMSDSDRTLIRSFMALWGVTPEDEEDAA
jgi:hypothetical protein